MAKTIIDIAAKGYTALAGLVLVPQGGSAVIPRQVLRPVPR